MIVEKIIEIIVAGMSASGYFGLFLLMALESMIAPVPSEVVMPFAGYLVLQGKLDFWASVFVSGFGSIFGSLASYYIGFYGGRPFILKYGRYVLLEEEHLMWTEKWFKKQGDKTIFISRFIPVVRHLISIPAGIARMSLHKFIIYTFIGATAWNLILLYAGYKLGSHWSKIHEFSKELDIIFIAAVILFLVYFLWKHNKNKVFIGFKNRRFLKHQKKRNEKNN